MFFFCFIITHLSICFPSFQEHVCLICMHVCLHVCICVDVHVYGCSLCMCVHSCMCASMRACLQHICAGMCACMHVCLCVGLRLSGTFHPSSILFSKAVSLSRAQSTLIQPVYLIRLLWEPSLNSFSGWNFEWSSMLTWCSLKF